MPSTFNKPNVSSSIKNDSVITQNFTAADENNGKEQYSIDISQRLYNQYYYIDASTVFVNLT